MIAAFPPPITGQALAAKILSDGLDPDEFKLYRLNFNESVGGDAFLRRILCLSGIASSLIGLCIKEKELIVYLQMGYGKASILRDMVFLTIAKLFKKECVVHIHGSGYRIAFDALPAPLRALEKRLLSTLNTVIVLSPSLKTMFNGLVEVSHLADVPNGVAPDVMDASTDFTRAMRSPDQPFRILFLSNMLKMKGYMTVLQTAKRAHELGLNWRFDLVGPKIPNQGDDVEQFIAQNELTDTVHWHDTVEGIEKMDTYKQADCFVMPSFFEGQPLCILEAMHFALPILAKPVGGIPDIFASNPNGVVFFGESTEMGTQPGNDEFDAITARDAQALLEALKTLAEDPNRCHQMGRINQDFARTHYTPQAHVQAMRALFQRVAQTH